MATGGEDMEMQERLPIEFRELEGMEMQEPVWVPELDVLSYDEKRGGDTVKIQGSQPEQSTVLEPSNLDAYVTPEDIRLSLLEQEELSRRLEDLDGIDRQLAKIKDWKIKTLDGKIRQITRGRKYLTNNASSADIINRTKIKRDGTITWRRRKDDGILGVRYFEILIKNNRGVLVYNKSEAKTIKDSISQFKELVNQIDMSEADDTQVDERLLNRLRELRGDPQETDIDTSQLIDPRSQKSTRVEGLNPQDERELGSINCEVSMSVS